MYSRKKTLRSTVVLLLLVAPVTGAADIDLEFEFGIGHTDNITRSEGTPQDPEIDDTVYAAGMRVLVDHQSARSEVDLRGSLFWHDYKDGPYGSETLPALDATALVRITDQVFSWFASGNIGQMSVNPFQPVTPDNRQDISFITTGPSFYIPLGTRFSLRADAWYSDVQYETQPTDNTRTGALLGLARQISPSRSLSLNFRGEETEFDEEDLLPSIDRYDAFLQFVTEGSRNEVTVDLGYSEAERSGNDTEEPMVNVEWRRQVSPETNFLLAAGTRISDSAENFRGNQQGSVDIGDVQNQQGITDPYREDYAGLTLTRSSARTGISVGVRWSEDDYGQAFFDRDRRAKRANFSLDRQLSSSWSLGVFGRWEEFDYQVLGHEDEDTHIGISLTWAQLRTLEIELRVDRNERDSTDPMSEYTENRAYLGFRYSPTLDQ